MIYTGKHLPAYILPIACLGIFLGILFSGLWPLVLRIPNKARLLGSGSGIRFTGESKRYKLDAGGVAFTPDLLRTSSGADGSGEISIEICLIPFKEFTSGVGTIVVFCDRDQNSKLIIGQWKASLIVRTFYYQSLDRGSYTEIGMLDALMPGRKSVLTVTSGQEGTSIYVNGEEGKFFPGVSLLPPTEKLSNLRIFLGNDPDVTAPWSGEIEGLVIYDRELTAFDVADSLSRWKDPPSDDNIREQNPIAYYRFTEVNSAHVSDRSGHGNALLIPTYFQLRQRPLQAFNRAKPDVSDMVINVAGFVPLGLSFFLWLRRWKRFPALWAGMAVLLFGLLISLGIEWTQSFLPSRSSSLMDVMCNALGVVLGVSVGFWVFKKKGPRFYYAPRNSIREP